MSSEVKSCPSCGDEYTLQTVTCADCGVALVLSNSIESPAAPEAFPETSELECIRIGPLAWTRALSAALEQAQIRHRVEPDTRSEAEGGIDPGEFDGADVFGTWVMSNDLEAALRIDASVFAHVIGQAADAPAATEDEICPACQSPIAIDALSCPDCGLNFG